jgi:hypothetical protein
MMQGVLITGIAGSGKTTLTKNYAEWLKKELNAKVYAVNLDPGVLNLPYSAVFDARDMVRVEELMISEGLGPNGALIKATEMLAQRVNEIVEKISSLDCDYIVIDTPGQMEVFALRWSGRVIAKELGKIMNLAGVFLGDYEPGRELIDSITAAFLSKIIELKLGVPMIPTVNKLDLWRDSSIKEIWESLLRGDGRKCFTDIRKKYGVLSELLIELSNALTAFSSPIRVISISATTTIGFEELFDALNEVWCACGDLT